MRKYWLLIIIAAIFKVVWVVGLKHAVTGIEYGLTALAIFISFGGLILSGKHFCPPVPHMRSLWYLGQRAR